MGVWCGDWVDHMEIGIGQVILLGWLIFQTYFVLTSARFVYLWEMNIYDGTKVWTCYIAVWYELELISSGYTCIWQSIAFTNIRGYILAV